MIDFDFSEKELEHQILKKGKYILNLPKHQIENHSNLKFYNLKIAPQNSYAPTIHSGGDYVDFDLNINPEFIYKKFIMSFKLTENNQSDVEVISGPMILAKCDVLQNGNSIFVYDDFVKFFMNACDFDKNSYEKNLMTNAGILSTDYKKGVAIPINTNKVFYIELHSILSNINFYRPLCGNGSIT